VSISVFTCSHVRPVVWVDESDVYREGWFHIGPEGKPGGECFASIFRDSFELPDDFHNSRAQRLYYDAEGVSQG
jgi:hypothetical protein